MKRESLAEERIAPLITVAMSLFHPDGWIRNSALVQALLAVPPWRGMTHEELAKELDWVYIYGVMIRFLDGSAGNSSFLWRVSDVSASKFKLVLPLDRLGLISGSGPPPQMVIAVRPETPRLTSAPISVPAAVDNAEREYMERLVGLYNSLPGKGLERQKDFCVTSGRAIAASGCSDHRALFTFLRGHATEDDYGAFRTETHRGHYRLMWRWKKVPVCGDVP